MRFLFVDSSVKNYQSLVETAKSDTKVVILDSTKDGVAQITEVLAQHQGVEAIEIISHGKEGTVRLGKGVLSKDSLSEYSSQLQQWGEALSEEADILLYGCNVAADETGIGFIRRLSQLTGADVAASEDLTGNSSLGGDWDLEVKTGDIESVTAITSEARETYTEVLPISVEYFDGTDTNDRTEFKQWKGRESGDFQNRNYGYEKPPYVKGNDHFGIRFAGYIYAHETGTYKFREGSDDGVRLWVDNKNIIDEWNRSGFNYHTATISLEGGKWYPIQMDYFEKDAGAEVELKWKPPSKSSLEDIPDKQLIPLGSSDKTGANDLGYGLKGEYKGKYFNRNTWQLIESKFTQVDSTINFDWKGSSPKSSSIDNDDFSVVWKGSVVIPKSGFYRFFTETDDGVRLYIDNQLVINHWNQGASGTKQSQRKYFSEGQAVPITLQYHENGGDARAKLYWEASTQNYYSTGGEIISKTLIPATSLIPYSPENRPVISVEAIDGDVSEAGKAEFKITAEITAERTIPPGGINVFYNLKGINGASKEDFSDPNLGQLVLTPSNPSKIVEINITNDLIKEQNEQLQLEILPGVQYTKSSKDSSTVNIIDNEPSLKITKLIDEVNEKEGQKDLFKIELLDPNGDTPRSNQEELTISLKLTGNANRGNSSNTQPGSDYKLYYTAYKNKKGEKIQSQQPFPDPETNKNSYDISVPSGTEYITIQAKEINDAIFESEESITVEIKNSKHNHYGVLANKTATVKLIDNEPSLKINKLNDKVEGEQERIKDIFKIELLDPNGDTPRSNQNGLTISLKLTGNANRGNFSNTQPGSDYKLYYTAYGEGKEIESRKPFPNPETNENSYGISVPSGTEYVTIQAEDINDEIFEFSESITVEINKREGYGILSNKTATANLIDNEPNVSLGKVVHPAEGMGFGSTISSLGSALVFSKNEYIAVAENANLDLSQTGTFTQEAWIFSNSNETDKQGIIGYQTEDKSAYPSISIVNEDSIEIGFGDGKNWNHKTVEKVLNPDAWNHVATTFDGTDYKLYVNAVEVFSTADFAGKKISSIQQLEIGKAGNHLFTGAMDEVRVWNVARSAYEIQSLMVSQLEGNENGLVGYWNFNQNLQNKAVTNNLNNGSGNNLNQGTLQKAAINFDGTNDYVALRDLEVSGDLTIEAQIYVDEHQNWARILELGNGAEEQNIFLAFAGETGKLQFRSYTKTPGNAGWRTTPNPIPTKQWVHVAATVNNDGLVSIYVDGELTARTDIGSAPPKLARTKNYLGWSSWGGDRYFNGKMREVRVWDVARTQSEIQDNKDSDLRGDETGLKAYYRGNVAQDNNTLIDSSQNLNGTLLNGASSTFAPVDSSSSSFIKNPAPQIGYVEVELDKPFQGPQGLWVKYERGGTATQNEDYFNSRYRKVSTDADTETDGIIIPEGETKGRIYFSALSDTVLENDETIDVKLVPHNFDDENQSSATNSNYGIDASSDRQTIKIKDNRAYQKGVILLDEKDRAIGDRNPIVIRNSEAQFKVRLSSQPTTDVKLDLSSDRSGLNKTELYFNSDNWNEPQAVALKNINDSGKITVSAEKYLDSNQNFDFTIDPPLRVSEGSTTDAVPVTPEVTVVSQNNIKEDEGLAGQFILNLSAPAPKGGVTIGYELGGSAIMGEDYELASPIQGNKSSITIPEGKTQGSVPIFPVANNKSESNKDITLTLKKINRELNFDGTDDYVALPDLEVSGDLTIEAQIYVDEHQNWARILELGNGAEEQNIFLAFNGETGKLQFRSYTKTTGNAGWHTTPNPIPTKQWVHVAATVNNDGLVSIYVDGELTARTDIGSAPPKLARTKNYLGWSSWGGDRYFNGKMREVRVWDVARTQSEIQDNKDSDLRGDETGLKAYYRGNVAEDKNTLIDSSQNLDGTLVNGANVTLSPSDRSSTITGYDDYLIAENNSQAELKILNDDLAGIEVVNAQIIEAEGETTTRYSDSLIPVVTNEPYPTVGDFVELKNADGTVLATVLLTQEIIDAGIVTIAPTEGVPSDTALLQANIIESENNPDNLGFSLNNANISLEDSTVKINLPNIGDYEVSRRHRSTVGIRLHSKPAADVTVSLKDIDDTETSLNKTTLTFTAENWDSYQLVEISGKDDLKLDGNIEYEITAEVTATEDSRYQGKSFSIPVKNLDDESKLNSSPIPQTDIDSSLPLVRLGDRVEVNEDSNLVEIEVNLSQPATKDTNVFFDVSDGSAIENQDYSIAQQVFVEQKEADGEKRFDSPFDGENPGKNSQPTFADLDNDGDLDAIVGTQEGIKYYENTGTANSVVLETANQNPFGDIEVAGATPSLGDLNGDGKLDLVLGKQDGTINYYINTSSSDDDLRFQVSSELNSFFRNPFSNIDVGNNANPFLIDFDGDGDLDLIAGSKGNRNKLNTLRYYQNTGSKVSPSFEEQPQHPITEIAAGINSSPFVVDWDLDGDLDILAIEKDGALNVFAAENGTYATNPEQIIAASKSETEDLASVDNTLKDIIRDEIDQISSKDRFEIDLEAGIAYTFDLEGSPTGKGTLRDTYLSLYDSNNNLVTSNDDGGEGLNSRIIYTPTTAGTFYIEAGGYSTNTGTYELSLPQENAAKFGATFADTDGDGDLDAFVGTPDGEIDYYQRFSQIEFAEGEQTKNIRLRIKDDSIAESPETFQVNLVSNTDYRVDAAEVSLKLDGQNDYIKIAHQDHLNVKEKLTLEAEVYLDENSSSGNRRIIQKGNNDNQYRLVIEDGKLKFDLAGVGSVTAPAFSGKQWHHVAGVYDGTQLKLYINGEEVSSVAASGEIATTTDNLNIGTKIDSAPAGDFWHGEIKEVRIWNVARSEAEIKASRDEIPMGLSEELIAYYPGRTNSDNLVVDSSIYNSYGELIGATSGNNISTTVAIKDNDTAGVTIRSRSDSNSTSETGDSISYAVKLNTQPTAPVTVYLGTQDETEGLVSVKENGEFSKVASLEFTAENWDREQTFYVKGVDDSIDDDDLTYQIITTVKSEDTKYQDLSVDDFALTNTDNDEVGLIVTGAGKAVEGRENVYSLKLQSQPKNEIRVIVTPTNDQIRLNDELIGEPHTLTFTPDNWNFDQTVRATALDDSVVEYLHKSEISFEIETGKGLDFESSTDNSLAENAIALGTILGGYKWTNLAIADTDDVDWFEFDLADTGNELDFARIDFDGTQGNLKLELYSAANLDNPILVSESRDSGQNFEEISLDGQPFGKYYVKVSGNPNNYELLIADEDYQYVNAAPKPLPVIIEDNDLPTVKITAGETASEVFGKPSYFTFQLDAPIPDNEPELKVNYRVIGGSATLDEVVDGKRQLGDYRMQTEGFVTIAPGDIQNNLIVVPIDDKLTEDLDLTVKDVKSGQNEGELILTVTTPLPVDKAAKSIGEEAGKDLPANNSTSGVLVAGNSVIGNISSNGDRDRFKVQLETGKNYIFDLEGSPTNGGTLSDTYFRLYDSEGKEVARNDDGGEGLNSRLNFTPQTRGNYYAEAGAYSDRTGSYKLTLTGETNSDIPNEISLSDGTEIKFAKDLIGTVQNPSKLTKGSRFYEGEITLKVDDPSRINQIVRNSRAKIAEETVIVELLEGEGYKLPENTQATLRIKDDEVPGVRIVQIGDNTVVEESETASFQVSLLSEPTQDVKIRLTPGAEIDFVDPINPTTVEVDKDVYRFDNTKTGILDVKLDSLVETEQGKTVAFEVNLRQKPSSDFTVELYDANNSDGEPEAVLSFTKVEENLITGERPGNWDRPQQVVIGNLDFDDSNKLGLKAVVKNKAGEQISQIDLPIDHTIERVEKQTTEITISPEKWFQLQTVPITGVDDGISEPGTYHKSNITYEVSSSDSDYNNIFVPQQRIDVTDPLLNPESTAQTLQQGLTGLQNSLDSLEVPLVGSLDGKSPKLIKNVSDKLVTAVSGEQNLSAIRLKEIIEDALKGIGLDFLHVSVDIDEDDINIALNIKKTYDLFSLPLDADLGLDALGINFKSEGEIKSTFEMEVVLGFGLHKDFGFYMDTDETKVEAAIKLGLDKFKGQGNLNFLRLDLEDDLTNKTELEISLKAGLNDLDNYQTLKFFDVDGDGQLDADTFAYPIKDRSGTETTKNPGVREPFVEVSARGKAADFPTVAEANEQAKRVNWNGNNSFDEATYEKNEGIYRTQENEYYFDLNRNGRLDNNNQEKLLSVTKEGNAEKKWFDKQGRIKPFRIEEKTENKTKIYYFDKNGNNLPDENEKIIKKEKAKLDKNNNGKLDGDINLAGEGKFVRGTGIAFADNNNNKKLDIDEKYVHSQFDELTLENSNLALSFLDLNGDKQQTDNTSIFEGESSEVSLAENLNEFLIREAIDEKTNDSFLYLDLTGNSEFSEGYIKDGSKNLNEPKLIKDAAANIFFLDLNGDEKQNSYQEPLINEVGNKDAFLDLDFNGDRNSVYEPVINKGKNYLSFIDGNQDDKQEKIIDYNRDGLKNSKDRLTNGAVQTGTYRNGSSFQYLDTTGDEYWTQEHQVIKEGGKNYLDINNDGKKDNGDRQIINVDLNRVKENDNKDLIYLDENNNNQRDNKELLLLDKFTGRLIKDLNDNSEIDDDEPAVNVRLEGTQLKSIKIEEIEINYSGNDLVLKNLNGKTINYLDESQDGKFTREYQVLTDDTNNNNYGHVLDENGNKEVDFSKNNSDSNDPLIIFKDATIKEDKSLSLDLTEGFVDSSHYLDYNNNGEFDDKASERSIREYKLIKKGKEYHIDRNSNGVVDSNEPAIDVVEALDLDDNKQFTAGSDLVVVEKKQGETTLYFNDKNSDRTQNDNEPFVFNNIAFLDLDRNQKLTLNEEKTPDDFIVEETYLNLNNNSINDPGEPQLKDDSWVINEDYVVTYEIIQKEGKTFIDQFPEDSLNKSEKGTYQATDDIDLNKSFSVSNFQAQILGLSEGGTYTAAELLGLNQANNVIIDSEITFVDLKNDGKLDISIDPLVKIVDGVRFVDLDRNGSVTLNDDEDPVELVSSPNNEFDTESLVDGEIITLLDDGSRLTLKELQNFKNDKELKFSDLFSYEFAGTANLGLATKTSIEGDPAFPSIGFNLGVGLPLFNYGDQEQSGDNGLTIEFKDMKLDLGTFLTDFVSPIIETADEILSFTKPVVDLLNRDTKLFSYLDLEDSFNKDSRPGVSILDIGMTLAEGINENTTNPRLKKIKQSIPKAVKFVETVTKITELSASLKKLTESNKPIVLDFGDYTLSDFKAASDDPADVASKAGSQNKTTTQAPGSETKTPIEQAQDKATPAQKGALSKLRNLDGLELPILENPITLVKLLLGESNVDLVKYDIPDLEFAFSKEQQFPLWTPPTIAGALELDFEAKTDFSLGYDTGGYEAWQKTDYELAQIYQLLDGFYLDDWDDDGSEKDELSARANITAGLSASVVVAKAMLSGGIEGTLGFDIVDEGELQGKNDGKIRGSEIITRLDTPIELFDFKGKLDAFLKGEIRLGLDAGLFEIMKTVWSKELGRITLAKFNVGANGVTFSSSISGSYINAATVFFDGNFNDVWDEGEPITFTNEYGQYDLEIGLDWDSNQDGTIDELDGQIISVGGYDTSSGLPAGKFIGLPDSTIITPLTSLQVPLVQSGLTGESADTLIKQQLGLDPNFDLETFDSLNAIGQQEELGLDIYLAHISIQALFNQGRALLDGLQGDSANPNNLQIVQETLAQFLQNRAESTTEAYNLGNVEDVKSFLNFLAAENDVALTTQQLETIASFITQSDRILQEVAEVGSSKSILKTLPALASVKRVIQSDVPQLIERVASSSEALEKIVVEFEDTIEQNYVFADEDINAFGNRSVKITTQKDTINEADGATEFIVELSQPAPNQGLTVLYSISGTATLKEDYQTTEKTERTVYVAPGETTAKIAVAISDDLIDETTENITVNLQSVGEGYIIDPLASVALLQIIDNDESADIATKEGKTLIGSLDDDLLDGSAGEDRLEGGYGNDTLHGKEGNDFLQGSQGKDSILGGLDNDTLEGNFDDDTLEGNAGNDLLDGGAGNDLLRGNEGVDAIAGGTEDDTLEGNAGNDLLEGNAGDDILRGGSDNDWLVGDTGNDILDGGSGDDVLSGGEDADVFFFDSPNDGFDNLIDFDPAQGDKIQISAAGFGVDNTDDFRFISGILDFKGQDLALIQNRDTTYSYFPNLDDVIEVIDRPTPLTNPDLPVKSNSNKQISPQPSPTDTVENSELTILDDILQRGHIRLGISSANSRFDLEFTRTLAAALFGDASKIETVDSNFFEAFNLVADGTVDLASQRYTHTSQRDGELNIDFSPVYFYDSQGIIVRKDSGIENGSNLQDRTIGVFAYSTSLDNLKNVLNSQGIEFTSRSFDTVDEMIAAYDAGMVDAYSIDKALIIENLDDLSDPENHHLLDLEFSKEPIALALPENDSQWADVVRWVNYVPVRAEEFGINSENIAEIVAANTDDNSNNDSSPEIRRFLGIEGKIGAALGLNNDFAVKIIEQVGNYGEIYDRHFSQLQRDRNLLQEQGGLFYSLPFSGSTIDSELIDNDERDLLAEVRSRGYLKLGLPEYSPGFATKQDNGEYVGFDVDLGRAIAAALFGDPGKIEVEIQSFQDSFANTANGVVDLSAMGITHNLVRDASMGIDFSPTYLYTGQGILVKKDSGIDILPSLNGRRVGTVEGTTSIQNFQDSLSEFAVTAIPVTFASHNEMFAAYEKGEIDAVTTDLPILSSEIPAFKNPEEHQILDKVLSKEPLALIIDENQSQWADIVKWVQYSLVQAEELDITSENIDELIAINTDDNADNDSNNYVRNFLGIEGNVGKALGLSDDFAVNVIKAVGNYGEIYEHNLDSDAIPRAKNQLYTDFGLQYSLPFTSSSTATENTAGEDNDGGNNDAIGDDNGNDTLSRSERSSVYRFFNPSTGVHFYTADETESNYVRDYLNNYVYEGESYASVDPLTENTSEEVYRFFNSTTGGHLYTTDENERDYIINNLNNFIYEDVKLHAYETQATETVPVYRFYEPTIGTHFYTPNEEEKTYVEDYLSNYTYEGIAYYAFPIDNI